MSFQFLCPQGHLLEGDESHMGMACQCPQCGITFLIPTIPQQPAAAVAEPQADWAVEDFTQAPAGPVEEFTQQLQEAAPEPAPPAGELEKPAVQDLLAAPPPKPAGAADSQEVDALGALQAGVLHIPCPNGHELEAPLDMIGHPVICPYCSVQFRLQSENSVEYREHQEVLDRERAQFWFKWAIIIGIVVGLGLLTMIIMAIVNSSS